MNTIKFINIAKRITAVSIIVAIALFMMSDARAWDYLSEDGTHIEVKASRQMPPARLEASLSINCDVKRINIDDSNDFFTLDKIGGRVKFDKSPAPSNIISMVLEQSFISEVLHVPEALTQKIYEEIQKSYGALFEITVEKERRFYEFFWGGGESKAMLDKFMKQCPTFGE